MDGVLSVRDIALILHHVWASTSKLEGAVAVGTCMAGQGEGGAGFQACSAGAGAAAAQASRYGTE